MKGYQEGIGRFGPDMVSSMMIKNKLLLVAILAASVLIPAAVVRADGIQIQVGDRPFYNHGPRYWNGGYQMIWVPGHMSHYGHHWIHGQYVRGTQRRHDWDGRNQYQHNQYDRDDDRR